MLKYTLAAVAKMPFTAHSLLILGAVYILDKQTYIYLNAELNLFDEDGNLQLHKDREAVHAYLEEHVRPNTRSFSTYPEQVHTLISEGYYDPALAELYTDEQLDEVYQLTSAYGHTFPTFVSALKFYKQYSMKDVSGKQYLENFAHRVTAVALSLARGDIELAKKLATEMITGRYQPATPTFLNMGKVRAGKPTSCYLINVSDSMVSISKAISSSLFLSKEGGGVALNLTDLRELNSPIKGIEGQASGVIPVMKLLEDSFSYANQLGARQGAGAVYLHAHHPDIMRFLDTKRENADEKIRIKSLSIGIVIPDVTFHLARNNQPMYLFSPYDVERVYGKPMSEIDVTSEYDKLVANPNIKKDSIDPRKFFQTVAELQFESGYPYMMFCDTANRANPIEGTVKMSNLCISGSTVVATDEGEFTAEELWKRGGHATMWDGKDKSLGSINVLVDRRVTPEDSDVDYAPSTQMVMTHRMAHTYTLSTVNGREIRATQDHKFAVKSNNDLGYTYVELKDLQPGDEVLVWGDSPYDTVDSVTAAGTEPVYDVQVSAEVGGNSFVANGFVVHNCTEIMQTQTDSAFHEDGSYDVVGDDISCNLGSLNIAKVMDGGNLEQTVGLAMRSLTAVTNLLEVPLVPTIDRRNKETHAVGLGAMNLQGFLAREGIAYNTPEAVEFTSAFMAAVNFYSIKESGLIAQETGEKFRGFDTSSYADGSYFDKYVERSWEPTSPKVIELFSRFNIHTPTPKEWKELKETVQKYGLYHQYRMAVAPTGSISYVANATQSLNCIPSRIEVRKEGMLGRVYAPAPYLSDENMGIYMDAYQAGAIAAIDIYAAATAHIDQGASLTLHFPSDATTRDVNKAQIYAWNKGHGLGSDDGYIKSLYYMRLRQQSIEGTEVEGCVSCSV